MSEGTWEGRTTHQQAESGVQKTPHAAPSDLHFYSLTLFSLGVFEYPTRPLVRSGHPCIHSVSLPQVLRFAFSPWDRPTHQLTGDKARAG